MVELADNQDANIGDFEKSVVVVHATKEEFDKAMKRLVNEYNKIKIKPNPNLIKKVDNTVYR